MYASLRQKLKSSFPLIWSVLRMGRAKLANIWLKLIAIKAQVSMQFNILRISRQKRPVRVGFFVVFSGVFQLRRVFELMIKDADFQPEIFIIPDISRGREHMVQTMDDAYRVLAAQFDGYVHSTWTGTQFEDVSPKVDIAVSMNPYPAMTHELYRISSFAKRGKPCLYANYGARSIVSYAKSYNRMVELSYLWRYYVASPQDVGIIGESQRMLSYFGRIRATGISRLDDMAAVVKRVRNKKTVLLCPHHTIRDVPNFLSIGNFVAYSSFLAHLPELYPEINWIFRPHPLLMWSMVEFGFWTKEECENYLKGLLSHENVVYQPTGDYYDAFVNSDAMIQDCCAFVEEYLDTGHPQCYVLRSREHELSQFTEMGEELLSHTYKAYSEQDIIDFIENVVIAGKDPMKKEREKFAKEKLMFNYPHASEAIVADIKKALGRT